MNFRDVILMVCLLMADDISRRVDDELMMVLELDEGFILFSGRRNHVSY